MKLDKKSILIAILAIILIGVMIGGTVAWLTASAKLVNTFTVGTFVKPTTKPGEPTTTITAAYIYEPSWDEEETHKLIPGAKFDKDPYVGIGAGSEDAIVYVSVENNFKDNVYFTLNANWEAVEATEIDGVTPSFEDGKTYTSGIFKYTAGLNNAAEADVWTTTPVFSQLQVADDATASDLEVAEGKTTSTITVKSFIHQTGSGLDDNELLTAAKQAFTAMDSNNQ